jgi:hypothetical protein
MSRQAFPISRVTRSKDEARATYTRLSRWYESRGRPFERSSRERGQSMVRVKEGECVLEIGFGTGYALVAFAQSVGSSGRSKPRQACGWRPWSHGPFAEICSFAQASPPYTGCLPCLLTLSSLMCSSTHFFRM